MSDKAQQTFAHIFGTPSAEPHTLLPHEIIAKAKELEEAAQQVIAECEKGDLDAPSLTQAIIILASLQAGTFRLMTHLAARPGAFPFL